jgi:hypothetical protein
MARLVPTIHAFPNSSVRLFDNQCCALKLHDVDGWNKPGHDGRERFCAHFDAAIAYPLAAAALLEDWEP